MNYLIKWQFTKENSIPFKTQAEILNSNLIPLVEDGYFQKKKFSFYITKVYYTNVRLAVFVTEENLTEIQSIVKKYTGGLIINAVDEENKVPDDWNGIPQKTSFNFNKNPSDIEETFYTRYLEDITNIGLDFHKKSLTKAVSIVVKTRFETKPFGELDPKEVINRYFSDNSEYYRKMSKQDLNIFWSNSGFYFSSSGTRGDHFFYNIILGEDFDTALTRSQIDFETSRINGFLNKS